MDELDGFFRIYGFDEGKAPKMDLFSKDFAGLLEYVCSDLHEMASDALLLMIHLRSDETAIPGFRLPLC